MIRLDDAIEPLAGGPGVGGVFRLAPRPGHFVAALLFILATISRTSSRVLVPMWSPVSSEPWLPRLSNKIVCRAFQTKYYALACNLLPDPPLRFLHKAISPDTKPQLSSGQFRKIRRGNSSVVCCRVPKLVLHIYHNTAAASPCIDHLLTVKRDSSCGTANPALKMSLAAAAKNLSCPVSPQSFD